MRKAMEWFDDRWSWVADWIWFYYIALSHLVNGLDWQDAKDEAAELMNELHEQRYQDWMEGEKERKAECRRIQGELAEEIKKAVPEVMEMQRDPEYVASARAALAELRQDVGESGVAVVELLDAMDDVQRILDQTTGQVTEQVRVA